MTVTLLLEANRSGLCEKCTRLLPLSPVGWKSDGDDAEHTAWLCARDWPKADQLPDTDLSDWLPVRPDGWTPFPVLDAAAEPVALQVVRFLCPFCRRGHGKKSAAVDHIGRCWWNPGIRGCKTCRFYQAAYTAPASSWCEPGRQCSCNDSEESCWHENGPELSEPIAGCPLWRDRDEEEDEPAEDQWDRDARALNGGDAA